MYIKVKITVLLKRQRPLLAGWVIVSYHDGYFFPDNMIQSQPTSGTKQGTSWTRCKSMTG